MVSLLDLLFPRRSLSGSEGEWITTEERARLQAHPVSENEGALRRQGIRFLDRLVSGSSYRSCPLLQKAIHTMKFRSVPWLAEDLGNMIAGASQGGDEDPVLCPVPLHWTRRFHRGFNQALLLAEVVGARRKIRVKSLLRRIRATGYQSHRSRADRLVAVRDAFRAIRFVPEHIILIDDVASTGSTLDACAKALKCAGAKRVEGWVIARS